MDEIAALGDLFFEELSLSGEVDRRPGTVVDAGGEAIAAEILTIGPFCAAYRTDGQTGFCATIRTTNCSTACPRRRP